jgi:hypothetical protein
MRSCRIRLRNRVLHWKSTKTRKIDPVIIDFQQTREITWPKKRVEEWWRAKFFRLSQPQAACHSGRMTNHGHMYARGNGATEKGSPKCTQCLKYIKFSRRQSWSLSPSVRFHRMRLCCDHEDLQILVWLEHSTSTKTNHWRWNKVESVLNRVRQKLHLVKSCQQYLKIKWIQNN